MKAIFIHSLPRSGSTLLLRTLLRCDRIQAMSEGWSLLPLLNSPLPHGMAANYRQDFCSLALRELIANTESGLMGYQAAMRQFWMELHTRCFPNADYVVDKTPPYSVHVAEILDAFPDAYHIMMWRNPLPLMASFTKSGGRGRFVLPRIERELLLGWPRLVEASKRKDRHIFCVRYEDLCARYETVLEGIWSFLEIKERQLRPLDAVRLAGSLGDPGPLREAALRPGASPTDWKELHGQLRKEYIRRVVFNLGEARVAYMGYDYGEIIKTIETFGICPLRTIGDTWYYLTHILDRVWNIRLAAKNLSLRMHGHEVASLG